MRINRDWGRTGTGIYVPTDARPAKRHPVCVDLFCGCGGISLGFMQAGFQVIAGMDYDAWSALTYMVNLGSYPINIHYIEPGDKERLNKVCERQVERNKKGNIVKMATSGSGWIRSQNEVMRRLGKPETPPVEHFFFGDVRKISGKEILDAIGMKPGEVDCVAGGPPCQGFSTAGKREVMDPRNSLVFEFARLVLEIRPKTFMMENVPGMLQMVTPEGIPVIDALCRVLDDGGFGAYDALKKSLLMTSGVGAAMRSSKGQRSEKPEAPKFERQVSLF
jgi:DNA (cytosine-5)-methyltransferase 1